MKRVLAIALWLLSVSLSAQVVTSAEYFWGTTDPGEGTGTAMSASDGTFDEAVEEVIKAGISLPSTNGIHLFNIRVKDKDGNWGPLYKKAVSIENSLTLRDIKVTGAEFFWGTSDPGQGGGTALLAFDNSFDEALESVFKNSISLPSSNGIHLFNIRVKDEDGNWGPLFKKAVSIENSIALRDLRVTAVEYFWGLNDPGAGNGYTVLAIDYAFDEALESVFKAGVYPPLAGWNLFNIRAADEEGNWGPIFKKPVWADEGTNPIQIQLTSLADIPCNGGQDARVYASIAGGVEPYTISWSNGANNDTIENLAAGQYVITVTDSTGQSNKDSIVISEPNPIVINTTSTTSVSCAGNDGGATFSISGGTPSYYISWSGGITGAAPSNPTGNGYTFSITNVAAGSYTATITDENGCVKTHTVTIPLDPNTLTIVTSGVDPTCYAGTNGSISVSNTGGQTPFSYTWSTGSTASSLSAVSAGTYWVSVTDGNNCTRTDTAVLVDPLQPAAPALVTTDPNCTGSNGSATITNTVSGTAYTWYSISGSTSTAIGNASSLSGLSSGQYSVSGVDANGCATQGATFTLLSVAANLNLSTAAIANVTCYGAADGFVNVAVSGGSAPYTYTWDNGTTGSALTGVSGGSYTVTVTDANGCIDSSTVTITEPSQALDLVTLANSNVSCYGDSTATITVSTTGAQGSVSYAWSNGSTGQQLTGLGAGTYVVTATDGNGCTSNETISVTQPLAPLSTSLVSTTRDFCNSSSGSLTVSAAGGSSPYLYSWNTGGVSNTISNKASGTYIVTVTDDNGCTQSDSYNIADSTALITINASVQDASCSSAANGSLTVQSSGGITPYNYAWTSNISGFTGTNSNTIDSLSAGMYYLTITDNTGCAKQDTFTVGAGAGISANIIHPSGSDTLNCFSDINGSLLANSTNGYGAVTYSWSNGHTNALASGLTGGTYWVTITDAAGCIDSDTTTIYTPPALSLTLNTINQTSGYAINCDGDLTGQLSAQATGGTGNYSWNWSNGAITISQNGLGQGTYWVIVQDVKGCTASDTTVLDVAPASNFTTTTITSTFGVDILCHGDSTGSAWVNITNPNSIIWDNGESNDTAMALNAGIHYVQIIDSLGCAYTDTITLTEAAAIDLTLASTNSFNGYDISCNGLTDGSISASATGGLGFYAWNWDNGGTNSNSSNLGAGFHTVVVNDQAGCAIIDSIELVEPDALVSNWSVDAPLCFNTADGTAILSMYGGVTPYNWTLNGNNTGAVLTNLNDGAYLVSVTDANNCVFSDTLSVIAPDSILTSLSIAQPSCSESFDGEIIISAAGGTGSLYYLINNSGITGMPYNLAPSSYLVQIIDDNGCSVDTIVDLIALRDECLSIPNYFSPNDDGVNDVWNILGIDLANYTLVIFNVIGQELYRTESQNYQPWDGQFNGRVLPDGDYYYVLESEIKQQAGYVTLRK